MKLDNLYVVESPLQALVALELSLKFPDQSNGVIYRLVGAQREKNDQQIIRVLELGVWDYIAPVSFAGKKGISFHFKVRDVISNLQKLFHGKVDTLFFGEFRSQWMHFVRAAVGAKKDVLMDDGAATVTIKREYLDKDIYYPADRFLGKTWVRDLTKRLIYYEFKSRIDLEKPIYFASAFVSGDSCIDIDYSNVRRAFRSSSIDSVKQSAYFFGSKYSEVGIIARDYELEFISKVQSFYLSKGLAFMYCAHRDESDEKIELLESKLEINVVRPDLPAELFLLNCHANVIEIASAYSSVLNNISLIFPDKFIRSFRLSENKVEVKHRVDIEKIYQYYESIGIRIEYAF